MPGTAIKLIVGLGNPGREYENTRHNAGFWFVDALARAQGADFRPHARYQGDVCRVEVAGREITLLKPQTYMNRSGLAIRALLDYQKVPAGEMLVVHDELDLPPGVARIKLGGGHGGHNGLRDTITHVGPEFWRLRLGIGHPGDRSQVIDYVLHRPTSDEEQRVLDALAASLQALETFVSQGAEKAMHWLHTRTAPPAATGTD
jgi:PTH1 family peptidyl-tRNA hydrolase